MLARWSSRLISGVIPCSKGGWGGEIEWLEEREGKVCRCGAVYDREGNIEEK